VSQTFSALAEIEGEKENLIAKDIKIVK